MEIILYLLKKQNKNKKSDESIQIEFLILPPSR